MPHLIAGLNLFHGNRDFGGFQIGFQLLDGAGSADNGRNGFVAQDPGQGKLRKALVVILRDFFQLFHCRKVEVIPLSKDRLSVFPFRPWTYNVPSF